MGWSDLKATFELDSEALSSRSSRSMVQSGVHSTKTGLAPSRMIVDGRAVKVNPFVRTSSPLSTPTVMRASMIADEHELTPTAYLGWQCEAVEIVGGGKYGEAEGRICQSMCMRQR